MAMFLRMYEHVHVCLTVMTGTRKDVTDTEKSTDRIYQKTDLVKTHRYLYLIQRSGAFQELEFSKELSVPKCR